MRSPTIKELGLKEPPAGPAYLLFDIETAPALAYVWSAYKTNIIEVKQDWYLLSFAYKWLGQRGKPKLVRLYDSPTFEPWTSDDLYVAKRLNSLMDRADVVIAHNGDRFDVKKANTRFLFHDIDQPSPYQTIDTYQEAKRSLGETQNTLNALTQHYGLPDKLSTEGFALWRACMEGDPRAWRRMGKYNIRDVEALEAWYLKLRPYIGRPGKKAHPNRAHWQKGDLVCPKCGSDDTQVRGWHRTIVSEYPTVFCKTCRGYSRIRERKSQRDGQFVRAL